MNLTEYLLFLKEVFIVIGLGLNLIGACVLYRSVKSYQDYYQQPGQEKSYPIAVLDKGLAKKGICFIIVGIIFQLLAVFTK